MKLPLKINFYYLLIVLFDIKLINKIDGELKEKEKALVIT